MAKKISLVHDASGSPVQGAFHPTVDTQLITIGATTAKNANALTGVEIVRLIATGNCHVKFGNITVEATSSDMYLASGREEYFNLQGDTYIAIIRDASATGSLFITPVD